MKPRVPARVWRHLVAGRKDDAEAGAALRGARREVFPGHAGQLDVGDEDVEHTLVQPLQGGRRVSRFLHGMSEILEHVDSGQPDQSVVLHQKDP